jgi:hypothetical protein
MTQIWFPEVFGSGWLVANVEALVYVPFTTFNFSIIWSNDSEDPR